MRKAPAAALSPSRICLLILVLLSSCCIISLLTSYYLAGFQCSKVSVRIDADGAALDEKPGTEASAPSQQAAHAIVVPEIPASAASNVTLPAIAAQVVQLEREGKGRKIVSMSLYGNDPRYTYGAIANALLVMRDWEGWTLRLYYGEGVPEDILTILKNMGVELVHITSNQKGIACMYWRFYALEDRTATHVIVRDIDARLTARDREATMEWVRSGMYFHVMNDHPGHSVAVMGGMWGSVSGFIHPRIIQAWRDADERSKATYVKGSDQTWLASTIWPEARYYALQHASFYCNQYGPAKFLGYPTPRYSEKDFVGNVYWKKEFDYEGLSITDDCPKKCRRNASWTKC